MSSYVPTDVGRPLAKPRSIFQYVPYQRVGLFTAFTDFALVFSASVAAGIIYHAALFEPRVMSRPTVRSESIPV